MKRAVLPLLVVLFVSCNAAPAKRSIPTEGPASVGKGLVSQIGSPAPSTELAGAVPKARPLFVLTLRDQNGNPVEAIPVRFEGPVNRVVVTDASGMVKIVDPPGDYRMRVDKGCYPTLRVIGGVFGTVHMHKGQSRATSLKINWQHRFAPSAPAATDAGGDWPVGRAVRIRFGVQDRCKEALAPRASYTTFAFHAIRNIALVGTPHVTSDASGYGTVTVKCTAAGDPQFTVSDTRNPPDNVDLVAASIGYNGKPRCVKT